MSSPPAISARAAFQHKNFSLYQAARFIQVIGVDMQAVAIAWQVYALTGDPLHLGYIGLAHFVPFVALIVVGGHTADRFDRHRIFAASLVAQGVCALALLTLTWSQNSSVGPIYLVMVVFGGVRAFGMPATQALLPNLVPPEHFTNAVTWSSTVRQVATIAGPAAGGLLYGFAGGAGAVYLTSAISLGLAFGLALGLRPRRVIFESRPASWSTVLAGFGYVWRNRLLLGSMSMDLFAVLLGGAVALLPVYAKDILHVGPSGLGILRSAPAVGAATLAVALAHRPLQRRAGAVMLWCVALFGVATVVFGLSTHFVLSVVALAVLGASDMVSMVVRLTLEQIATPEEMRGRVGAVNGMFIGASNELGEFRAGISASLFGAVPAVVMGGVGTLLVVGLWSRWFPELRRIDRLEVPQAGNDPGGARKLVSSGGAR